MAALMAGTLLSACAASASGDGPSPSAGTPLTGPGLTPAGCTDAANWAATAVDAARRALLDIQCGVLRVPRDHADPARGYLDLAVERVRSARQHDRIGALLLNPGGPGASGVDRMPDWAGWMSEELLERFDLVTFDPRGTGSSSPIDCPPSPSEAANAPLPDVLDDEGFAQGQANAAAWGRTCVAALGDTAGQFGTDTAARDLDLLRQAVGDDRLTYVGWSYGARLGAHYAHLFPDRIRALVLDAPPHPTAAWADAMTARIEGFEATLSRYVADCPQRDTCGPAQMQPRAVLDRVVAKAREHPIPSGRPAGDPPATWDTVLRGVLAHLAARELWPLLDAALIEADHGDSGSLYDLIDAIDGHSPTHPQADATDALDVILCTDSPAPADLTALRRRARAIEAANPSFGALGAWWLFACSTWPGPRTPLPAPTTTTTAPALVIGSPHDPATPYAGAVALADLIGPNARLLTSDVDGHTSFGRSRCVGTVVTRLLLEARLQSATRCD
ncbi:MAG: alpha/beta hydrolase [Kineosporiaceae bacterium]